MEHKYYRDNLAQILAATGGRNLLNVTEVCKFTGLSRPDTVKRMFPFHDRYISAATLARCLCEGGDKC